MQSGNNKALLKTKNKNGGGQAEAEAGGLGNTVGKTACVH